MSFCRVPITFWRKIVLVFLQAFHLRESNKIAARMKKIFGKNFIIFLTLILASCAAKDEQQTKIRIVDLQGKSHPITTKFPELNTQALAAQGRLTEQNLVQNEASPSPQNYSGNRNSAPDYGAVSSDLIQKTLQPVPTSNAAAEKKSPVVNTNAPQVNSQQAGLIQDENQQSIEYDLSKPEEDALPVEPKAAKNKAGKKSAEKIAVSKSGKKGLFVQVGSFSNSSSAKQTLAEMQKFHKGRVEEKVTGEKTIYRVLLGPFSSKKAATDLVQKITDSGHEAVLMRNK